MLNYSLQICQRDSVPDYELMGMLFRKLIELSPSRRDALDRVRHFEQLATGQSYSDTISDGAEDGQAAVKKKSCPFEPIDVDYVSSISFNYGLSLMDMGQVFDNLLLNYSNSIMIITLKHLHWVFLSSTTFFFSL